MTVVLRPYLIIADHRGVREQVQLDEVVVQVRSEVSLAGVAREQLLQVALVVFAGQVREALHDLPVHAQQHELLVVCLSVTQFDLQLNERSLHDQVLG